MSLVRTRHRASAQATARQGCGLQQLGSAPYGLPTPSAQIRLNFLTDRVGASGSSWLKGLSRQFKRHRQGRPGWFIEEHRDQLRLRSVELPQGPGETGSAGLKPSPSPPLQALLPHPQPWLKPARSSFRSVRSHGRGQIPRPPRVPKIQPTFGPSTSNALPTDSVSPWRASDWTPAPGSEPGQRTASNCSIGNRNMAYRLVRRRCVHQRSVSRNSFAACRCPLS